MSHDMIQRMRSRSRSVGSIIARAIVFLLLGAIVNIAVAWGLMVGTPSGAFDEVYIWDEDRPYWPKGVPKEWPEPGFSHRGYARGFSYESVRCTEIDDESYDGRVEEWRAFRLEIGWPMRGMVSFVRSHQLLIGEREEMDRVVRGIILPDYEVAGGQRAPWPTRILPLLPLWPGFAINTLFYAGVLWLLFAAPFALRRRRRIKRGLCPACAYPIGESEVCTECGKAVPRSLVARERGQG